jgi:coiled-coil domain-containing protein 6
MSLWYPRKCGLKGETINILVLSSTEGEISLLQLRQEKCRLEQTLEQEQECLVNKLMRKIEKLEAETLAKQSNLEQLRREKVELENTLEQEQEALVNKLWKRMDKLEAEKRYC